MSARGPARAAVAIGGTTLALVALLAGASAVRAQCEPKNEQDVLRLTIDVEQKIADLEKIKRQIEVEHDVLMLYPGGAGLVRSDQAAGLFSHAVLLGAMHPDSIVSRVREMRAATNYYLKEIIEPDLADQRACLERIKRGPQAPPAPGPPSAAASQIDWPAPMDWIGVKGVARGSYVAECSGYRDYPAFRSSGTWRLEFRGDGKVKGVFGDDAREYTGLGEIKADGSASGESRSTNAEVPYLKWTAQFQRSGIDLLVSSHTLDLMAPQRGVYAILVECKPGYMRQEQ